MNNGPEQVIWTARDAALVLMAKMTSCYLSVSAQWAFPKLLRIELRDRYKPYRMILWEVRLSQCVFDQPRTIASKALHNSVACPRSRSVARSLPAPIRKASVNHFHRILHCFSVFFLYQLSTFFGCSFSPRTLLYTPLTPSKADAVVTLFQRRLKLAAKILVERSILCTAL